MKKLIISVITILLIISTASAATTLPDISGSNIIIESSTYDPAPAEPGNYLDLYVTIKNNGGKSIKNLNLQLEDRYPFTVVDSIDNEIKELVNGREKLIRYKIYISEDVLSGDYSIPIKACTNKDCSNIIKESNIEIVVNAGSTPIMEIGLDDYNLITPGSLNEIIITSVNKGKQGIQFLTIDLKNTDEYTVISTPRKYMGELLTDDFERETYTIYVSEEIKNSKSIELDLSVEYSDMNYKKYNENEKLTLNVYTQKDAQKIGLAQKSNGALYSVLFLVISFFTYRHYRRKKKRNAKWIY